MVKKVEAYVTSDGQLFMDGDAAARHEQFNRRREGIMLLIDRGNVREEYHLHNDAVNDLARWLAYNGDELLNILQ